MVLVFYNNNICPLKEGEAVKVNTGKIETKSFVYAFALMDLNTHMYVGYGTGMHSENEAFNKAVKMLKETGLIPRSARFDKHYGGPSTTYAFDKNTTIFILPRNNITIRGPPEWKHIIESLMLDPFAFLDEYYRRKNSESAFSADKRCDGWKVWQKLEDRIDTAVMCKGVWHNLFWLGGEQ